MPGKLENLVKSMTMIYLKMETKMQEIEIILKHTKNTIVLEERPIMGVF